MSIQGFADKKMLPYWVNATIFVMVLLLSLQTRFSADDWKNLTDPYDYLKQAKIPITSAEFFFPHKVEGFDPRPFTVPLFYKFCSANTDTIVQMQRVVLWLSAFFLVNVLISFLEKTSAKYFLIAGLYLLLSWWNVLGWTILVLSESISASLLLCWIASLLWLYKKNNASSLLLHIIITILLAFTRDSWPYVLICFYAGICALWLLFKQPGVKNYFPLLFLSLAIFFVQQQGTKTGLRYQLPVINNVVVRILPNPAYTRWFVQHGMPDAEKLQQNFGKLDVVPEEGQHKLWSLYTDTAYQSFLNWVKVSGQSTYTKFMLLHPDYILMQHQSHAQLARIMSHDLFYIDEPRGYSKTISRLFPLFNMGIVTVLCIMLLMIYTKRKNPILFGPVLLALFTLINAILCYNADSLEVERHLYLTNILVQLIGFWAVALIWDALIWRTNMQHE